MSESKLSPRSLRNKEYKKGRNLTNCPPISYVSTIDKVQETLKLSESAGRFKIKLPNHTNFYVSIWSESGSNKIFFNHMIQAQNAIERKGLFDAHGSANAAKSKCVRLARIASEKFASIKNPTVEQKEELKNRIKKLQKIMEGHLKKQEDAVEGIFCRMQTFSVLMRLLVGIGLCPNRSTVTLGLTSSERDDTSPCKK